MLKRILLATVILGFCSTSAFAQTPVVFDNLDGTAPDLLLPNDEFGIVAGSVLDDFSFGADTTVTGIGWLGAYVDSGANGDGTLAGADDFTIQIFSDNGAGLPNLADEVASFAVGDLVNRVDNSGPSVADAVLANGDPVLTNSYSADVDFVAEAGTSYWVSLQNNTAGDFGTEYNQVAVSGGDGTFATLFRGQPSSFAGSLAFTVSGTQVAVPEPSTLGLLGLGLIGFVARRRR